MKNKRRKYTHEFKEEAAKLFTEQGYQLAERQKSYARRVESASKRE